MTPGTWYARLSPEARAKYIARAVKRRRNRKREARAMGRCLCTRRLRLARTVTKNGRARSRMGARCQACAEKRAAEKRKGTAADLKKGRKQ